MPPFHLTVAVVLRWIKLLCSADVGASLRRKTKVEFRMQLIS